MQMSLTIFGYKTNKWIIMEEESNRLNKKQSANYVTRWLQDFETQEKRILAIMS